MQPDLEPIRAVLPQALRSAFDRLAPEQCGRLEELRLRAGRPFTALIDGAQIVFSDRGNALMIRPEDLTEIVSSACGQSIYSASEPIAQGYLDPARGSSDRSVRYGSTRRARSDHHPGVFFAEYPGRTDLPWLCIRRGRDTPRCTRQCFDYRPARKRKDDRAA